jgi:hypothetical protein
MLKKSLIAVAVVAMLAASAQAGHVKKYDWPGHWVWDCVDICDIPVYMKVGMYIEILDQDKLEIIMKQVEWKKYKGCVTIKIKCNIDITLSCKYTNNGVVPGEYSCTISDPCVLKTLSDTVAEREICVEGKKVEIVHSEPGGKVRVGTVTLCVKPGC